MKKFFYTTISKIIMSLIYTQNISANINNQYAENKTTYFQSSQNTINNTNNTTYIKSKKITTNHKNKIEFTGNVEVIQKNNILCADKIILEQTDKNNHKQINKIIIEKNIKYQNNYINITGNNGYGYVNLTNKSIDIFKSNYELIQQKLHGNAFTIMQRNNGLYTILENGSMTSCLSKKENHWKITGSNIVYDNNKNTIEIWDAIIKIKNIPIFYSSYFKIPINNKKNYTKTTTPIIKINNQKKFEFTFPYYFNLIPKYKITIQPKYTISNYININTIIQYPTFKGEGKIESNIIKMNKSYNNKFNNSDYYIYFLNWKHKSLIKNNWTLYTNITKFNKSNNYHILNLKNINISKKYAKQKIFITFNDKNWNNNLEYKQLIFFNKHKKNNTYNMVPQLNMKYTPNNQQNIFYTIFAQITKFKNNNKIYPETIRLHIEPCITLPIEKKWSNTYIEGKIKNTKYIQNNIQKFNKNNNRNLQKHINRIIPQIRIKNQKTIKNNFFYKNSLNSVMETKIQYLYTPYYKQNNIGLYDTYKVYQNDYNTIYRNCAYSGLDRITYANKFTSSITTKLYNKKKTKYLMHP